MKTTLKLLLAAGALLLAGCVGASDRSPTASAPGPDKNFYIFLCFGQSNMEGYPIRTQAVWAQYQKDVDPRFQMLAAVDFPVNARNGTFDESQARQADNWYLAVPPLCRPGTGLCPADYFGRTLVANLPKNVRVGVINVAVAGAKIEIFDKVNYGTYLATAPDYQQNDAKLYGGSPYQRLVDLGKEAQKVGVIKGILLHHGESNSGDQQWPNKVKAVYDNLLHDLGLKAEDVPLLAGEVVAADQQGQSAGMNKIIDGLPKTIATAHVVSATGCTAVQQPLHFDPAGYQELGTRYAVAMIPLLGYKPLDRQPVIAPPRPARGGRGRGPGAPPAAAAPVPTAPTPSSAAPATTSP
jgi:hypothetical protein